MSKKDKTPDFEAIAQEERSGFDLRARLQNAPKRTRVVTVYTDAAAGEELGGAEDREANGIKMGQRRWGIRGRLADIADRADGLSRILEEGESTPELLAEIADLEKEQKALTAQIGAVAKRLQKSALVYTLVALPRIVKDVTEREARKRMGVTGKIPQNRLDEYRGIYAAELLSRSVTTWTDKADGTEHGALTFEQAKDLFDYLPEGEFDRLDKAMYALSFEAAVAEGATDNVDF